MKLHCFQMAIAALALSAAGCGSDLAGCVDEVATGPRRIAARRDERFLAKVQEATARCRGGDTAVAFRGAPWVDWSNYYATGDASSRSWWASKNLRGVGGALIDLEYERVELIKFNLFDNAGTYPRYVTGADGVEGPAIKQWPEMRLPPDHPRYADVGGAGAQRCSGALIRGRTLTGICNDITNPLLGSTGTFFARNVEFESTFPDAGLNTITRNRHGDRLSLLTPDPQVISRTLFTRAQSDPAACNDGAGKPGSAVDANCDYTPAPFFNVLAAFWIQFMTHDWFSHLEEGHNGPEQMPVGCTAADAARLGCRPGDAIDKAIVAQDGPAPTFGDPARLARAPKTFRNTNTAWWDASQLYGYDDRSRLRVKRDPADRARLLLSPVDGRGSAGDRQGYLPTLAPADPMNAEWVGQEATAFPDNWTVGTSFYHNLFAREHNLFVEAFRARAAATPDADSGLRDPSAPARVIHLRDVSPDELFEAARLVVAAEIAKIHTIEWTTQLLYDEPLYKGMNGNWNGLLGGAGVLPDALGKAVERLGSVSKAAPANELYSVMATGPGIFGLGSRKAGWQLTNVDDVNGGVNHFGSPFNFPEEFVTVYRLHPLVPDLLEYRDVGDPNIVAAKIPVIETFRGKATNAMHERGLGAWALTLGRQRLGLLTLNNHPRFLQHVPMGRLNSATNQIDVAALDIIRDRERGVPRFNEFRRQYGLRTLTGFDDLVDPHLAADSRARQAQQRTVAALRGVYGQHRCDQTKVITLAQKNADGSAITDCLGHPNGSMVDNIEDLDTVVGWLAEPARPHGFAISETQFVVFILNASRRLFSDRFFTSSFRAEFYTTLGVDWVNNNGPETLFEPGAINGHAHEPVSPLKRILLRAIPELAPELAHVVNVFDPWARDRGEYYSLEWKPRPDATADKAFSKRD
jgi:hypothetical protein